MAYPVQAFIPAQAVRQYQNSINGCRFWLGQQVFASTDQYIVTVATPGCPFTINASERSGGPNHRAFVSQDA
jgi:hypothetical protein